MENMFWYVAIFSSVCLVIFFILSLVGLDHHDIEHDSGHFQILSIRNLVIFLTMFGWVGLAMLKGNHSKLNSFSIAFLVGTVMMFTCALFIWFISSKAVASKFDYNDGVGKSAIVYSNISENNIGQITLIVCGKQIQAKAKAKIDIKTGQSVKVISWNDGFYNVEIN